MNQESPGFSRGECQERAAKVSQLFSFGMFFSVAGRKCPTGIEIAESMRPFSYSVSPNPPG